MCRDPAKIARNDRIAAAIPDMRASTNFHSWQAIADHFGVSKNTVLGLAHRRGLTDRRKRPASTQDNHEPQAPVVRAPSPPRRYRRTEHHAY